MHPAANDLPPAQIPGHPPAWPTHPEIESHEPRNLLLLATHQIVFRAGWIFKTESVIMPAFLDAVAGPGAGWLRGCMPVLNRFGQSVPPVFCANRLKAMRHKKLALFAFTLMMSLPLVALSLSIACTSTDGQYRVWMPGLFLALYGVFFVFNGLYHLSFGTVQGKLIRPRRRGRLLLISTFWGSIPATLLALWLLPGWLDPTAPRFECIFGFTALCFALSALTALLLFEPGDGVPRQASRALSSLTDTWAALRRDANLRCLAVVAMLFGSGLIIFPHYQALAREKLDLSGVHLMVWVVTQNVSVGAYSLIVGPLADAMGNRVTLRVLIFGSVVAPLFAIFFSQIDHSVGGRLYWTVFIPLGVTPLVLRILVNYALEICEPVDHPRYLSTVNLCLAVPFVFSPAVGWLVDAVGFKVVFLSAAGLISLGGYLTFHLDEPRHHLRNGRVGDLGAGGEE